MNYLLYNLESNNSSSKDKLIKLYSEKFDNLKPIIFNNLDYDDFFNSLNENDIVILSGGDGTINYFANIYKKYKIKSKILYSPSGTGNDFYRDIEGNGLIELNKYLNNLPKVIINDKESYFINNASFGIDGTVCEVSDIKKKKNKKANYTRIALKLLLFKYKPKNAKVIVDGKEYNFKRVWLASTFNGRFVGGGMKIAPDQDRFSDELSCVIIHTSKRLRTLIAFKSIFKGIHNIKYPKFVTIIRGKEIKVTFDKPNAIQIDGEVTLNVTSYLAKKEKDNE